MSRSPTSDADAKQTSRPTRRRRRCIIIAVVIAVLVVIGLVVGLAVGLTQNDRGEAAQPTSIPAPQVPNGNTTIWKPVARSSWQIVLEDPIELSSNADSIDPDVDILDIDLFTNPKSAIDTLHRLGKKVICYFSAGSYEPYRPDSGQFESSDFGKVMDGWPDERWLDINSANVRRIMADRLALAKRKGCDGVDPDNMDGYNNENGLGLSTEDSINYMRYLTTQAFDNGLAIGLKNGAEIVADVESIVQFAVNEQCAEYQECGKFAPLIEAGKPVFHIEYPEKGSSGVVPERKAAELCSDSGDAEGSAGFSTVLKDFSLDGWVQFCDGSTATTPVVRN